MKRLLLTMVAVVALAMRIVPAMANPAPGEPTPANAAPADPFAITPDAGPWVICAASFVGSDSHNLAEQLVRILRDEHKLAAYIYDRGDAERRKDWQEHLEQEKAWGGVHLPFKHPKYMASCAVLIGGFADMDTATAGLAKVKKLPSPKLKTSDGKDAQEIEFLRVPDKDSGKGEQVSVVVNQLARSFVTRNPTVPAPRVEAPKFDPVWKELNAPESYSLLKNPKPWTLVVKEYVGSTRIDNRSETFWEKITQPGRKPGDGITAAGLQAHQLAEFLRDKRIGFDAYVLHTRTSSIVTVGGFDSLEDPELQRTLRRLQSLSFRVDPRAAATNPNVIKNDPIGLSSRPLPMEVPHF